MAKTLTCPACNRVVKLTHIGMTNDGEFHCRSCMAHNPRADWFNATPGAPFPAHTYFYWGAKTKRTTGAGLARAMTRNALFAGGPATPMSSLRTAAEQNKRVSFGYVDVATGQALDEVCIHLVEDDVTLYGRYFTPGPGGATKVVLVMSGSGGVAADYCGPIVRGYKQINCASLCMNYRGFGRSTGCASSRGTYSDVEAMLSFLTDDPGLMGKGHAMNDIVMHGYSLGSGPATEVTLRKQNGGAPAAGLVLHCPMDSSRTNFIESAPKGLKSFAGKMASWGHAYNNIGKIGQINCPILVIKGLLDDMAPQADNLHHASINAVLSSYNGGHLNQDMIFNNGDVANFINGLP